MRLDSQTIILAALTLSTTALAATLAAYGIASWIEAAAFVTGAICVWLTVRENIWNFPIGLANVSAFVVVFANAGLYGDAALQVVYFILGIVGWWMWLFGGANRTALRVVRAGYIELTLTAAATLAGTLLLWKTLHLLGGSSVFLDALTTSLSLAAQWLLTRKRIDNWIAWIVVDIIYIPLYLYKDLHLTALLYAVFLCMAVLGFLQWRRTYLAARTPPPQGFEVIPLATVRP